MSLVRVFMAFLALLLACAPAQAQSFLPAADAELLLSADALLPGQYIWSRGSVWRANMGAPVEPVRLHVSIAQQKLYVYKGNELIGAASVSTGKRGKETPLGEYPILQKARFHRSNIYSNAPMPFMQRLTWTGIALHAGENPGHPASHGCIRLPYAFARDLFSITRMGTQVSVNDQPRHPLWLPTDNWIWADWQGSEELALTERPHWYARPPAPTDLAEVRLDYSAAILLYDWPVYRRY